MYESINILDERNQNASRYILIERVMRLTNGLQYRPPQTGERSEETVRKIAFAQK